MRVTAACAWRQAERGIAAPRHSRHKTGMNEAPISIAAVANDPSWLADRYDPGHDAIHFRRVEREAHRKATFLTPEYLGAEPQPLVLRRSEVMAALTLRAPLHFIFHSAYCCSTLLARAFDIPGRSMGLKEPVLLNDMVGWRHRGGEPRAVGAVLGDSLQLLSRPFSTGEAVIIKPSNLCNGLADAILALAPSARALLLYAPLPIFLASVARKGMWGRLWVRELMVKQLREGYIDLGLDSEDYLGLTDLQAAAVGWLAQHDHFHRLIVRLGADRVASLDSERLLAHPADALAALARLYGIVLGDDQIAAIVEGPAFRQHSKFGTNFDQAARSAEQRDGASVHAEEIEKVGVWAGVLAENKGIPMSLGAALI